MADGEPDSKRPRNGDTVEDLRAQMLAMQQQLESQKAQIKALEATKTQKTAPATPTGGRRTSISSPNNSAEPSRVLHCRDLPPDATEAEVSALLQPFGHVSHVVMVPAKNQALAQLPSVAEARAALDGFRERPAEIRSKTVAFSYSVRASLIAEPRAPRAAAPQRYAAASFAREG